MPAVVLLILLGGILAVAIKIGIAYFGIKWIESFKKSKSLAFLDDTRRRVKTERKQGVQ